MQCGYAKRPRKPYVLGTKSAGLTKQSCLRRTAFEQVPAINTEPASAGHRAGDYAHD
jgi:hypothetical protein